jgi:hypothetical protein
MNMIFVFSVLDLPFLSQKTNIPNLFFDDFGLKTMVQKITKKWPKKKKNSIFLQISKIKQKTTCFLLLLFFDFNFLFKTQRK